jgi:amphi-Trp domain-containing protein
VSDVKVEQKQQLSREEVARFVAALAEGLAGDGKVEVALGNSTLELSVADRVRCELEVEVDGDEIELELELKWSTSGRGSTVAADDDEDAGSDAGSAAAPAGDVQPAETAAESPNGEAAPSKRSSRGKRAAST